MIWENPLVLATAASIATAVVTFLLGRGQRLAEQRRQDKQIATEVEKLTSEIRERLWERAKAELTAAYGEIDKLKARLDATKTDLDDVREQLRQERARNAVLEGENDQLRARVDELERRVNKGDTGPLSP